MKGLKKKTKGNKNILFLLSAVFFIVAFVSLCIFMKFNIVSWLDSDDSSELILSKLLADENRLITDKWYYSTELRVLNTQILYAFFFHVTQNWLMVRLLSFVCLYIIMLLSLFFMMDRMKFRKYFFIVAGILCIPFSGNYFLYVQKGAFYIPHITISFLAIGLTEWITDSQGKRFQTVLLNIASFLLAFIAGLSGARQIVIIYLPLLFSGLFLYIQAIVTDVNPDSETRHISFSPGQLPERTKLFFVSTVVSFIGSAAGYMVNAKILSDLFSFLNYDISFSSFDLSRLSQVAAGFLNTLGFTGGAVFSSAFFYNAVCFACFFSVAAALIYGYRQRGNEILYRYSVVCLASVSVFALLYAFSSMAYLDRYNIPIIVLAVPLSVYALSECSFDHRNKAQILISIVLLLVLRGGILFFEGHNTDRTSELRTISNKLVEKEYFNGYATFWNANILTELTDGKIEVWDWGGDAYNDFASIDQTYQWLQLKSHVSEHPADKVFWVLANEDINTFHFAWPVSPGHIIYETPEDSNWDAFEWKDRITPYKIYGFSSYDEMYYMAGRYSYNNELTLAPGMADRAGSTTLYPDTYTMICMGENLESVDVCLNYKKTIKYKGNSRVWDRPFSMEDLIVENGSDYLVCDFSLNEIATDIQPIFTNTGDENARISSVQLFKKYVYYADFWSNSYLINGYDEEGIRHLDANATSYGPYITLVPGKYVIECVGENLDYAVFDCVFNEGDGLIGLEPEDVDISGSSVRFTISIDRVLNDFEVRFMNNSGKDITMHRLTVRRE